MISQAERDLNALGFELQEFDFGREDEPDVTGAIAVGFLDEDTYNATIIIRPGTQPDIRAMFAEWVLSRLGRLFEHGPEPDGWRLRKSDGRWDLWGRLVDFPPID